SGYSPVHPAHVPPNALRTKAVGTGPFKLKRFLRDQSIEMVRNENYFVKGRPYL
ncbi:MAG: peptide ABC transporter substrate-binding protein, partial [Gammaproteobacteria bacterium]|nr:peptide ABC transporter substrate-binding protein [Gammaproteobacteria bacterium]NIT63962.1 peptide ABC transporter substrate-binding protein [Gammaproteobacteria bacterium]NIV20367.1 peptide ABC transporter substrate-binding protein [Gammaproteobacteria bacterium]NIY32542.1 peptide ABC transporter substrate-binding protein [Gammaproteobacteria bacterium]